MVAVANEIVSYYGRVTSAEAALPSGRGRLRDELVVAYLFTAVMAATGLPTPLYPLYERELHLSALDVTAVYGVYAVLVLVTLQLLGQLSDRVGRRPVLVVAIATAALGELVLLAAPNVPGLYAGRLLTGIAAGLVLGSGTAYLADLAGPAHARRASALAVLANLGGQAVGTVLAGALSQYLPAPVATPYVAGLVMLCPVVLLVYPGVPETVSSRGRWREGVSLQPLRVPAVVRTRFWVTSASLVAAFSLLGFLTALTGAILAERLNRPGGFVAGVVTAGLFASAALVQLVIADRFFHRASIGALALLPVAAALLSLAVVATSLPTLVAAVLLTGAVVGVMLRAGIGRVLQRCPPEARGQISSAIFIAVYGGASLPTIAAGLLATTVGLISAVLILSGFVVVVTAGAASLGVRARDTDEPRTGTGPS